MKISKNFSYEEVTHSDTAIRRGLDNTPGTKEVIALVSLIQICMQKIRDHYGRVVTCTSGFRSVETSEAVGSSGRSQHCRGQAMDWKILGLDNMEVLSTVPKIVPTFDQLILEFYNENLGINSGWIHLSYNGVGENREQVLRSFRKDGETVYEPLDLTEIYATKNT